MNIPSMTEARELLDKGKENNPGLWVDHSVVAANCASIIAGHVPGLDPETAYIFGLLHDIGRTKGITDCKHIIDGYRMMEELGYTSVSKICLTHSFPQKIIESFTGVLDISESEYRFIKEFIDISEYDDYDRLIQLCDALAYPSGPCIIEKRLINVAIRRGINEYSIEKWKKYLELKEYFDEKAGENIYTIVGVVV